MLTALLLLAGRLGIAPHMFRLSRTHDGIHDWCPGFCPCDYDEETA